MRLHFCIIVFVFYMTNCDCGIIHSIRRLSLEQDNGKTRERRAEDGVNYSGCGSEVSEDVPESHPLMHDLDAATQSLDSPPSIKEKRCPRGENYRVGSIHSTNSDDIVGAKEPIIVKRRDLQSELNKRLCSNCLTRCNRFPSTCKHCTSFCTPEEMATITESPITPISITSEGVVGSAISTTPSTNDGVVGSPIENNNEAKTGGDARVILNNRFDDTEVKNMKRVYTIATLKSGSLKEVICKLLGIPDTSDIDTVVVWITTKSNRRPQFSSGYKKLVAPHTERLTDQLNTNLEEALRKKLQQGGKSLTNKDIEEVIGKIFNNPSNGPKHATKSNDKERTSYSSMEDEILPPYPIDPNSIDLNMPQILNPPVIEDTPYISLGEQPPENIVGVPTETRIGQTKTEESSSPDQAKSELQEVADEKMDDAILEENESPTINNLRPVETSTDIKKSLQKPEDVNSEFENEKKTEINADENDTLSTIRLKEKTKNKGGKIETGHQLYSQHFRENTETDEATTGVSQNIEGTEGVVSEVEPQQNLYENIGSSNPMQGDPQSHSINVDSNDQMIGMSENIQNDENKPQMHSSFPLREPTDVVHESSSDENHAPEPISTNQNKESINSDVTGTDSQHTGLPFARNSNSEITDTPRAGEPPTSEIISQKTSDIVESPDGHVSPTKVDEPPTLEARAHGLHEKNRQSNVQEMQMEQPVGSRSSEDVIVSPNMDSPEEEDMESKLSSTEEEAPSTKFEDDDFESQRRAESELSDQRGQQLGNAKTQFPVDSQATGPSASVDDFDKAAAALKDVEKLVQTIQAATKIETQNRLLGQEEPATEMEQEEQDISKFPTSATATENGRLETPPQASTATILSSSSQLTDETTMVGESKSIPQHDAENADGVVHDMESDDRDDQPAHDMENDERDDQPIIRISSSKPEDDKVGSQRLENVLWDTDRHHPLFKISRQEEQSRFNPLRKENSNVNDYETQRSQFRQGNTIPGDQFSSQSNVDIPETNRNIHMKDGVLGTPQTVPGVESRGEFSGETDTSQQPFWSNALGKFVTGEQLNEDNYSLKQPKDIFFIGNGIKLPLQMVRKNDGAVHLSVDLDKLCSCKNFSCPKNHTAIEETVGTILEKEAELKDQLAATNLDGNNKVEDSNREDLEDTPLGIAGLDNDNMEIVSSNSQESMTTHRVERGIADSKWLQMKSTIAEKVKSDSKDFSSTDAKIFKRSVHQEELNTNPNLKIAHDKILSLFANSIINNTANTQNRAIQDDILNQQITTTTAKSEVLDKKSNANRKPIILREANAENLVANNPFSAHAPAISLDNTAPNYITQLINKQLTEVASRMSDMEKINDLKNRQMLLSQEKLKNILNNIGSKTVFDSSGTKNPTIATDDIENKTWEDILKQSPIADTIRSWNGDVNNNLLISPNKLMKNILEKKDKGDEIFDEVTPIKKLHQFKTLEEFENKLEELSSYVRQYSKDGEKMIKKEARRLLNTHSDDVIKQEVEILSNILTWLKNLTR